MQVDMAWLLLLQVDDVQSLEPLLYFELRRTPECGDEFAAAVKAAMEYENQCALHLMHAAHMKALGDA